MFRFGHLFFTLMLFLFPQALFSGGNYSHMFVNAQYHYRYIWPHRPELKEHARKPARAIEFQLGWKTSGVQKWHEYYNLPSYGFGFSFTDLGNPEVLGEVRSGFMFMEFVLGQTASLKRNFRVNLGLSHFNTYYDPEENPENHFIGTPWNGHFNMNYLLSFRIAENLFLLPGASFTHFSNGAYRKPNRGINMFDVNLGLRYRFGEDGPAISLAGIYEYEPREEQLLLVTYSVGLMQRDIGDPTYMARTLTVNPVIQKKNRSRWGLGIDLFYDDHAREQADAADENAGYLDYLRTGGFVSCDIVFNRLSLLINLGTYLYYGYEPINPIYKRIGLRYTTNSGLLAHLGLKAHSGRADYVEWGLGYAFGYRPAPPWHMAFF